MTNKNSQTDLFIFRKFIQRKLYNFRAQILQFLLFKLRMCYPPWCFLLSSFDKFGIEFPWKGDTIIWNWPWRNKNEKRRFISIGFSGTGEFGDARYNSLAEIDKDWQKFESFERNNLSNAADFNL